MDEPPFLLSLHRYFNPSRRDDHCHMLSTRRFISYAVGLVVLYGVSALSSKGQPSKSLTDFGVSLNRGVITHTPPTVSLGLFNSDPLLDVACYADGKLQVYQNRGDGTFTNSPVWEKSCNGVVEELEWKISQYLSPGFADPNSGSDLIIYYTDGRSETITHKQMLSINVFPEGGFLNLPPMNPPLSFSQVWRSTINNQPANQVAVGDIDNDGKIELAYWFYPIIGSGDSTRRFVVYECSNNDSFVVDWDTIMFRAGGIFGISDVDKDGHKELIIGGNGYIAFLECFGPQQYRFYSSNLYPPLPGYTFKVQETDVNHDGTKEVTMLTSDGQRTIDPTIILVGTFVNKGEFPPGSWNMGFNTQIARYQGYAFDMAVGQIDGQGWDEIVPGEGSFGVNEPVPVDYLWYTGIPGPNLWRTRSLYTGLQSGTGAVMFINLDADTTMEFLSGAPGPIGHGSMFALKYLSDTTWNVMWVDSSLRNSPLWVNSGILNGQFVVAGANSFNPNNDTIWSQLHAYEPSGNKVGVWFKDSASIQDFHLLDIDNDGRTNLVFPELSHFTGHYLVDYETDTIVVGIDPPSELPAEIKLLQNYPNPFNPITAIPFQLLQLTDVDLRIYNTLGKEVKTLLHGPVQSGNHIVQWEGTTNEGGDAASGVYFYRLFARSAKGILYTQTRKMLLLR